MRVRVLLDAVLVAIQRCVRVRGSVRVQVAVGILVRRLASVRVLVTVLVETFGAALLSALLRDGLVGRLLALFRRAADDDGDGLPGLDDLARVRRLIEDDAGRHVRSEALGALAYVEAGFRERLLAVEVGLARHVRHLYVRAAEREVDGRQESEGESDGDERDDSEFTKRRQNTAKSHSVTTPLLLARRGICRDACGHKQTAKSNTRRTRAARKGRRQKAEGSQSRR